MTRKRNQHVPDEGSKDGSGVRRMSDARPFSRIAFCGTVKDCLPDAEFRALAEQLSASAADQAGSSPGLVRGFGK